MATLVLSTGRAYSYRAAGGAKSGTWHALCTRGENTYGKDAEAFRPERWLESDPAKLAVMVRTNDLIFGHGKFQCLGKAVAQIEIGKTVFEVSRNSSACLLSSSFFSMTR
jgi:cytochrome P450